MLVHVLLVVGGVFEFLQVAWAATGLQWVLGRRAAAAEVVLLARVVQAADESRVQAREVA